MEFETFNNQILLTQLGVTPLDILTLTKNGFDDEESLRMLDSDTLKSLGITNYE